MPIRFEESRAVLDGVCGVEEALPLLEFVQATPDCAFDLGPCTLIHSAVLQVVAASGRPVAVPPTEPFVVRLIAALGAGQS